MDRKLPVEHLVPGLFVSALDRPWRGAPFLLQGFLLEDPSDLAWLRAHCRHVWVDPQKSRVPLPEGSVPAATPSPASPLREEADRHGWKLTEWQDRVCVEEELPHAERALDEVGEVVADIFQRLFHAEAVDPEGLSPVVVRLAESVIRNPDALLVLATLRRRTRYLFEHALGTAVLALALARQLGFGRDELTQIGLGGLLLDAGASRLPLALLEKPGPLSKAEYAVVQRHVAYGIELASDWGLPALALEMVRGHHEREDGSGYPARLAASRIPLVARIAGIVDCYDALVRERPHARARTPHAAIAHLSTLAGRSFHRPLVEALVQCLGVYPAGSLVELNSGEVGLVLGHNRARRMQPRLLMLLDAAKRPRAEPFVRDLLVETRAADGTPYAIARALEDGAHGLSLREVAAFWKT